MFRNTKHILSMVDSAIHSINNLEYNKYDMQNKISTLEFQYKQIENTLKANSIKPACYTCGSKKEN